MPRKVYKMSGTRARQMREKLEKAAETRPHLLARPPYLPPELEHELPRDKRTALGVSVPAASVPGDTVAAPKSCKPSPLELLVELKRRQTTKRRDLDAHQMVNLQSEVASCQEQVALKNALEKGDLHGLPDRLRAKRQQIIDKTTGSARLPAKQSHEELREAQERRVLLAHHSTAGALEEMENRLVVERSTTHSSQQDNAHNKKPEQMRRQAQPQAKAAAESVWKMPVTLVLRDSFNVRQHPATVQELESPLSSGSSESQDGDESSSSSSSSTSSSSTSRSSGGAGQAARTYATYSGEISAVPRSSVADGGSGGGKVWRGMFWEKQTPHHHKRHRRQHRETGTVFVPDGVGCLEILSLSSNKSVVREKYRGTFVKGQRSGFGAAWFSDGREFEGWWQHDRACVGVLSTEGSKPAGTAEAEISAETDTSEKGSGGVFAGDLRGSSPYGMLSLINSAYSFQKFSSKTQIFRTASNGGVLHGFFRMGYDQTDSVWLTTFAEDPEDEDWESESEDDFGDDDEFLDEMKMQQNSTLPQASSFSRLQSSAKRMKRTRSAAQAMIAKNPALLPAALRLQALFRGGRDRIRVIRALQSQLAIARNQVSRLDDQAVTRAWVDGGRFGTIHEASVQSMSSSSSPTSSSSSISSSSSSGREFLQKIDSNNDGEVDEVEFREYFSAHPEVKQGVSEVHISGMELLTQDGQRQSYDGINGQYLRTTEVVNFRNVYRKGSSAALWWANNNGQLSWVVGPADMVGSSSIWAFVPSAHSTPDHSHGSWYVYSYKSKEYELQQGVSIVNSEAYNVLSKSESKSTADGNTETDTPVPAPTPPPTPPPKPAAVIKSITPSRPQPPIKKPAPPKEPRPPRASFSKGRTASAGTKNEALKVSEQVTPPSSQASAAAGKNSYLNTPLPRQTKTSPSTQSIPTSRSSSSRTLAPSRTTSLSPPKRVSNSASSSKSDGPAFRSRSKSFSVSPQKVRPAMTRAQSSSSGPKPGLTKTAGIQPVRGAASRVPSETVHEDPEEEADSELERVREQEDEAEIEAIMREMLQNLEQQLLEERKREEEESFRMQEVAEVMAELVEKVDRDADVFLRKHRPRKPRRKNNAAVIADLRRQLDEVRQRQAELERMQNVESDGSTSSSSFVESPGVSPTRLAAQGRLAEANRLEARLRQAELEREQEALRLREKRTSWLACVSEYTQFQPASANRGQNSRTDALDNFSCENREKVIESVAKAALKGFKMAAKASAAGSRAEICAVLSFFKGRKGCGAAEIPYFPIGPDHDKCPRIYVSIHCISNLPRCVEKSFGPPQQPQVRVKLQLVNTLAGSAGSDEAPGDRETFETSLFLSQQAEVDVLGNAIFDSSDGVLIDMITPDRQKSSCKVGSINVIRCQVLRCEDKGDVNAGSEAVLGECLFELPSTIRCDETRVIQRVLGVKADAKQLPMDVHGERELSSLTRAASFKRSITFVVKRWIMYSYGESLRRVAEAAAEDSHCWRMVETEVDDGMETSYGNGTKAKEGEEKDVGSREQGGWSKQVSSAISKLLRIGRRPDSVGEAAADQDFAEPRAQESRRMTRAFEQFTNKALAEDAWRAREKAAGDAAHMQVMVMLWRAVVHLKLNMILRNGYAAPDENCSSNTKVFAGSRISIKVTGLPSAEMNQDCTREPSNRAGWEHNIVSEVDERRLLRERVTCQKFGVLTCAVKFPAVLWHDSSNFPTTRVPISHPGHDTSWIGCRGNQVMVRLEVCVDSAKNLPKMDAIGKIDAYVVLNYPPHKTVATSVQPSTFSPSWQESFFFNLGLLEKKGDEPCGEDFDLSEIDLRQVSMMHINDLFIQVMDHDRVGTHECVGVTTISGAKILHRVVSMWRGLQNQELIAEEVEHVLLFRGTSVVTGENNEPSRLVLRLRAGLVATAPITTAPVPGRTARQDVSARHRGPPFRMALAGYQVSVRGRSASPILPSPSGSSDLPALCDSHLVESLRFHGVPMHETALSLSALLRPAEIQELDACDETEVLTRTQDRRPPIVLTTGPVYIHKETPKTNSEDRMTLMADYTLMDVHVMIENGFYIAIPGQKKKRHTNKTGPKVQVLLELCDAELSCADDSSIMTCKRRPGPGTVGVEKESDKSKLFSEVLYTTGEGVCRTQPSWGERHTIKSISWAACKRMSLRFRVFYPEMSPDRAAEDESSHVGECRVYLKDLSHDRHVTLMKQLRACPLAGDTACGHLQVSFHLQPDKASSYGHVIVSSSLEVSTLPPNLTHVVAEQHPVLVASRSTEQALPDDYSKNHELKSNAKPIRQQGWSVKVHEIVGLSDNKVRNSRVKVAIFSGADGELLGATHGSSCASGLWLRDSDNHIPLDIKAHFDSKLPIVAKIFSQAVSSVKRKLRVFAVAGRNLKAMDSSGTSDPYIQLCVGKTLSKTNDVRARSKVIAKNLNPKWDEMMEMTVSDAELAAAELCVQVWDKDLLASDDLIGQFFLPLASLQTVYETSAANIEDSGAGFGWHTLHDELGEPTGEIQIKIELMPPIPPPTMLELAKRSLPQLNLALVVYVVEACGLFAADSGGTSDPYLSLDLQRSPGLSSKKVQASQLAKTSVKEKTLNPDWHECFEFYLGSLDEDGAASSSDSEAWLRVEAFDHNSISSHQSLGHVRLSIQQLFPHLQDCTGVIRSSAILSSSTSLVDGWFDLRPVRKGRPALGQVHLQISITLTTSAEAKYQGDPSEVASVLMPLEQLAFSSFLASHHSTASGSGKVSFGQNRTAGQAERVQRQGEIASTQNGSAGGAHEVIDNSNVDDTSAQRVFTGTFPGVSAQTAFHAPFRLVAVVEQACRLKAADRNGLSDPYVCLSILNAAGRPVKHAFSKAQTHIILERLDPVFQEALVLHLHDLHGDLLIQVFDSDWGVLNSDDLIAQYKIPLHTLDEQALPLLMNHVPAPGVRRGQDGKRERTKPPKPMIDLSKYGKVKMLNEKFDRVANRVRSFVLDPLADSPALLPEEQALLRSAVRLDPLGVKMNPGGASHLTMVDGGPLPMTPSMQLKRMFGKSVGYIENEDRGIFGDQDKKNRASMSETELEVIIMSGRHMPKMDLFGSCDPYIVLQYSDQKYQTSVQSNTFDPSWSETFVFSFDPATHLSRLRNNQSANLMLRVFDHDMVGKHDKIGYGIVSGQRLSQLADDGSGVCEEENVLIYTMTQSKSHRVPCPVIGNDNEQTLLTLRLRIRPPRVYPLRLFEENFLDDANNSASRGGAGVLTMALMLEGGETNQADEQKQLQPDGSWQTVRSNKPEQDGIRLRATVFAPAISAKWKETQEKSLLMLTAQRSFSSLLPSNSDSVAAMESDRKEGILGLGLVKVRCLAARNLALCRLSDISDSAVIEPSHCDVTMVLKSNGEEPNVPVKTKYMKSSSMQFETRPQAARLGPVWMQTGSLVTNLSSSTLYLQVYAQAASGAAEMDGVAKDNTPSLSRSLTQSLTGLLKTRESNRTQHKALVASGSIDLAALSARSRAEAGTDRESFGWWRLETSSSGDESKQGSHGLELRVNVIEARDLVCKRHGDAQPFCTLSVILPGMPAAASNGAYHKTIHSQSGDNHTTDPVFNALASFEDVSAFHKRSVLADEMKLTGLENFVARSAQQPAYAVEGRDTDSAGREEWEAGSKAKELGAEGFLLVQVFDAGSTFRSKTFLGQTLIPLGGIPFGRLGGGMETKWYKLYGRGREMDKLKPRRRPHVADESLGAIHIGIEMHDRSWLQPHVLLGLTPLVTPKPKGHEPSQEEKEEAVLRGERLLCVTVVSANGLLAADRGGTSDPYCVLSLSSSPSTPFFTTSVKEKCLNPTWHESSTVQVPRGVNLGLKVDILDSDKFGHHDHLGRVDIPLSSLKSGIVHDSFHKVEGAKSSAGLLSVSVRCAKNLPAMDRNGKSDPYVTLVFVDQHGSPYPRRTQDEICRHDGRTGAGGLVKTRTVPADLNPVWEESFLLDVPSKTAYLKIECFDEDVIGRHDLLGTALVPVASLAPYAALQQWLTLKTPEGLVPRNTLMRGGKVESGIVQVELCLAPASPDACEDGELRLCLKLLDKEQLGVPVNSSGESPMDKVIARRRDRSTGAAALESVTDIDQAVRRRLENSDRLFDAEQEGQMSSHERLLHNDSYLAWAARSHDNFVHLSSFPRTPSPTPPEPPAQPGLFENP